MNFEGVEKHWLIDYIQIFQSKEFQSALTLPSPSSESRSFFSVNLLGEGGSIAGGGGRPHLQASFPSPASSGKFYTETRRWGGELKGWGVWTYCDLLEYKVIHLLLFWTF